LLKGPGDRVFGSQEVLCHPAYEGFWSVVLYDIMPIPITESDGRWVELYGDDGRLLDTSKGLTIAPTAPISHLKTTTSYPMANQTVPSSFTAYGSTNASSVTAKMMRGTTVYTSIAHIFNSAWYAFFQINEHGGPTWALRVYEGSSSGYQETTGIIVS